MITVTLFFPNFCVNWRVTDFFGLVYKSRTPEFHMSPKTQTWEKKGNAAKSGQNMTETQASHNNVGLIACPQLASRCLWWRTLYAWHQSRWQCSPRRHRGKTVTVPGEREKGGRAKQPGWKKEGQGQGDDGPESFQQTERKCFLQFICSVPAIPSHLTPPICRVGKTALAGLPFARVRMQCWRYFQDTEMPQCVWELSALPLGAMPDGNSAEQRAEGNSLNAAFKACLGRISRLAAKWNNSVKEEEKIETWCPTQSTVSLLQWWAIYDGSSTIKERANRNVLYM